MLFRSVHPLKLGSDITFPCPPAPSPVLTWTSYTCNRTAKLALWLQKQAVESWHRAVTEQPVVVQEPPESGLGVNSEQRAPEMGWTWGWGTGGKQGKASPQSLGSLSALPLTSYVTLAKSLPLPGSQFSICKMYFSQEW